MSRRTLNRLRPEKPCMMKMLCNSSVVYSPIKSGVSRFGKGSLVGKEEGRNYPALRVIAGLASESQDCLLIAFREWIGLDQFGFIENLCLSVLLPLADAEFAPEVMVRVDFHITFRCVGQFEAG